MAKAGNIKKGTMAAIIGIDDKSVEQLCSSYDGSDTLVTANYNAPGQVVISGTPKAIEWAMINSKKMGARLAVELNVSGAFHSPLMASATENLAEMINSLEIVNTKYPVYTNVDAQPVTRREDIKDSLIRQMESCSMD